MANFKVGDLVSTLTDALVTDAMGEPTVIAKGSTGTVEFFTLPGGNVAVAFPHVRTVVHYKAEELSAL